MTRKFVDPSWKNQLGEAEYPLNSSKGKRELFIGDVKHGETLEPQLVNFNGEKLLREILNIEKRADLSKWMKREKTEGALRIAESKKQVTPPEYMRAAAEFIHG